MCNLTVAICPVCDLILEEIQVPCGRRPEKCVLVRDKIMKKCRKHQDEVWEQEKNVLWGIAAEKVAILTAAEALERARVKKEQKEAKLEEKEAKRIRKMERRERKEAKRKRRERRERREGEERRKREERRHEGGEDDTGEEESEAEGDRHSGRKEKGKGKGPQQNNRSPKTPERTAYHTNAEQRVREEHDLMLAQRLQDQEIREAQARHEERYIEEQRLKEIIDNTEVDEILCENSGPRKTVRLEKSSLPERVASMHGEVGYIEDEIQEDGCSERALRTFRPSAENRTTEEEEARLRRKLQKRAAKAQVHRRDHPTVLPLGILHQQPGATPPADKASPRVFHIPPSSPPFKMPGTTYIPPPQAQFSSSKLRRTLTPEKRPGTPKSKSLFPPLVEVPPLRASLGQSTPPQTKRFGIPPKTTKSPIRIDSSRSSASTQLELDPQFHSRRPSQVQISSPYQLRHLSNDPAEATATIQGRNREAPDSLSSPRYTHHERTPYIVPSQSPSLRTKPSEPPRKSSSTTHSPSKYSTVYSPIRLSPSSTRFPDRTPAQSIHQQRTTMPSPTDPSKDYYGPYACQSKFHPLPDSAAPPARGTITSNTHTPLHPHSNSDFDPSAATSTPILTTRDTLIENMSGLALGRDEGPERGGMPSPPRRASAASPAGNRTGATSPASPVGSGDFARSPAPSPTTEVRSLPRSPIPGQGEAQARPSTVTPRPSGAQAAKDKDK